MVVQNIVRSNFIEKNKEEKIDNSSITTNFLSKNLDNNNICNNNNLVGNIISTAMDESTNLNVTGNNNDICVGQTNCKKQLKQRWHCRQLCSTECCFNDMDDDEFEDEGICSSATTISQNDSMESSRDRHMYMSQPGFESTLTKSLHHSPLSSTSTSSPASTSQSVCDEKLCNNRESNKNIFAQSDFEQNDEDVDEELENIAENDDDDEDDEIQSGGSSESEFIKRYKRTHTPSDSDDGTQLSPLSNTNGILIEKRHKCDICGKGFPYFSILESHKRCHTGEKPFSCHFCDKKFAQKATLQVHERTHTGERPYKCKYCDKTFAQYGTKTVHEKSAHLGIRNYKCPKCNKCLSSPSALYTHKKTHGDKSFQCGFCPKQFTLKNYLKLHIKQVHEHSERKHICKFCSKTFAYAGSLQVHVRTHTGERPYTCKFCPKAFASQGNLQSHERTHTGERPYTCQYCGRSFIQKSQLTAHEATHAYDSCNGLNISTENYDQAPCSTSFLFEQNINEPKQHSENIIIDVSDHMDDFSQRINRSRNSNAQELCTLNSSSPSSLSLLSATVVSAGDGLSNAAIKDNNNSKQNEFVCKFCGKRYAYASSLYVHTRLHTGERPFRCNFCDKSFTNQGNMQVHLRVHTGEKPYKCETCGKSYAQKVGLKIHQEQCQTHLKRRGSVTTTATNDYESSSTSSIIESMDCNGTVALHSENIDQNTIDEIKQCQNYLIETVPRVKFNGNNVTNNSEFSTTQNLPSSQLTSSLIPAQEFFNNNNNKQNISIPNSSGYNNSCIYNNQESHKQISDCVKATKTNNTGLLIDINALTESNFPSVTAFGNISPTPSISTNSLLLLSSAQQLVQNNKQFSSFPMETTPLQPVNITTSKPYILQKESNTQLSALSLQPQTLTNLLLEQLEQSTQQQQQLSALKTLIDLSSINNLPQLLPTLSTYVQQQQQSALKLPIARLPQAQPQQLYISQQNNQIQQRLLNSQILQQLSGQLLQIQQQNPAAILTTHNNNNIMPSQNQPQYYYEITTIPTSVIESPVVSPHNSNITSLLSDAQLHLVAEALHDLSKQQLPLAKVSAASS